MKTSELTGAALDWTVAKCWWHDEFDCKRVWVHNGTTRILNNSDVEPEMRIYYSKEWEPSTNWSQGGPIIEKEIDNGLRFFKKNKTYIAEYVFRADDIVCYGPTPLIAAMRAFVVSKLGDEVEVPDELL